MVNSGAARSIWMKNGFVNVFMTKTIRVGTTVSSGAAVGVAAGAHPTSVEITMMSKETYPSNVVCPRPESERGQSSVDYTFSM